MKEVDLKNYEKIVWPDNAKLYFSTLVSKLNQKLSSRQFDFRFRTFALSGGSLNKNGAHFFIKEKLPKKILKRKSIECYASEGRVSAVDRIIILDSSIRKPVGSIIEELEKITKITYPLRYKSS